MQNPLVQVVSTKRLFVRFLFGLGMITLSFLKVSPTAACTSILVTRGASADGSVIITYSCDDAGAYARLAIHPAADHKPDEVVEIGRAKIPQVPHTYKTIGILMNEHQLSLAETTFGGRPELANPEGLLDYPHLMKLALERARTAREAIQVITQLAEEYGYCGPGESISIADTKEAWILEIVGAGRGGKGAVWAAVRIPDGHVSCHANTARIGEIIRNDPNNCLFSANVESFAVEKGWYDPQSGRPFRFYEAYCPPSPLSRRTCDARVWSILQRAAPSKYLSPDYYLGRPGSHPYPFSLPPDKKLSVADVFALMRDHFEGTEWDMTQGIDAGPFGLPRRWRPLVWKVDGVEYAWPRPIATQQSAFTSVTQSRAWLPDAVGGLIWFGADDCYTSCYLPFYCGIDGLPKSFTVGTIERFSWNSAWWVFNFVSNYANLKYSYMVKEIQAAQQDVESNFLQLQPAVEKVAVELAATAPNLLTRFLTDYCVSHAELTVERWRALAEHLVTKYNDGYIRDAEGKYPNVGYPESWLRRVIQERGELYRVPVEKPAEGR